jgi:TetR/AcrR family transcriptional repressor of nem operon
MRYPAEHKEAVRARIITQAAKALRKDGLDGVSIPAIMKKVGLTHGGFYVHFEDRDALVAAAIEAAATSTGATVLSPAQGGAAAMFGAYLHPEHVEHPEVGCVLAALGSEGRRAGPRVRRAFAWAARGFVRLVDRQLHPGAAADDDEAAPSDAALARSAAMIGSVVLARLVDDPDLAARVLEATRRAALDGAR